MSNMSSTALSGLRAVNEAASLMGKVAKCITYARGPKGKMRCFEEAAGGPGAKGLPNMGARRKAGIKSKYSYKSRKGRRPRPGAASRTASRSKGRKVPRRGKGGRFVKKGR